MVEAARAVIPAIFTNLRNIGLLVHYRIREPARYNTDRGVRYCARPDNSADCKVHQGGRDLRGPGHFGVGDCVRDSLEWPYGVVDGASRGAVGLAGGTGAPPSLDQDDHCWRPAPL